MSIIAMLGSALGGTAAASAGATAASAGTASAGSSFLSGLMDKGASALSSIGTSVTDAVGMTDSAGDELETLNKQLEMLKDEAEAIKTGTGYTDEAAREADLTSNAARTQETMNKINDLNAKSTSSQQAGLKGTIGGGSAPKISAPKTSISAGQGPDQNALVGAAMSGLSGTLGGAPKTTQQQLIMAQNSAFGGFKL